MILLAAEMNRSSCGGVDVMWRDQMNETTPKTRGGSSIRRCLPCRCMLCHKSEDNNRRSTSQWPMQTPVQINACMRYGSFGAPHLTQHNTPDPIEPCSSQSPPPPRAPHVCSAGEVVVSPTSPNLDSTTPRLMRNPQSKDTPGIGAVMFECAAVGQSGRQ